VTRVDSDASAPFAVRFTTFANPEGGSPQAELQRVFLSPPASRVTWRFSVRVGDYGNGFSYSATTGVTTEAAATTLVTSPIATACFACHDTATATAHMTSNGGSIYAPRSSALPVLEQCMVCHGPDRIADIRAMHNK